MTGCDPRLRSGQHAHRGHSLDHLLSLISPLWTLSKPPTHTFPCLLSRRGEEQLWPLSTVTVRIKRRRHPVWAPCQLLPASQAGPTTEHPGVQRVCPKAVPGPSTRLDHSTPLLLSRSVSFAAGLFRTQVPPSACLPHSSCPPTNGGHPTGTGQSRPSHHPPLEVSGMGTGAHWPGRCLRLQRNATFMTIWGTKQNLSIHFSIREGITCF